MVDTKLTAEQNEILIDLINEKIHFLNSIMEDYIKEGKSGTVESREFASSRRQRIFVLHKKISDLQEILGHFEDDK